MSDETITDNMLYDVYAGGYDRGREAGDDDEHARAKRAVFEFGLSEGLRLAQQIVAGEDSVDEMRQARSGHMANVSSLIEDMDPLIEVFDDRAHGRVSI